MVQETEIFEMEEEKKFEIEFIEREIYEKAGERDKEEMILLAQEVREILGGEKRKGKGKLKRNIPEILQSEYANEYFVDGNVAYLPRKGEAIIVGDIHGDPESIISILEQNHFIEEMEKGNKDLKLVFLGDYLDRGKGSKKTIELVLDLKRRYPDNVILLRGNHEDKGRHVMGRDGEDTFAKELMNRFDQKARGDTNLRFLEGKTAGGEVFNTFYNLFGEFPSVLVAGNGLVAVHGGIPSKEIGSMEELRDEEDLLVDVRNIDPDKFAFGVEKNTGRRERGKIFGEDAFLNFMITVGAVRMIRSHQIVIGDGIKKKLAEFFFNGRLAGIFSTGGEKGQAFSGYWGYNAITPAFAKISLEVPKKKWEENDFQEITYKEPSHI